MSLFAKAGVFNSEAIEVMGQALEFACIARPDFDKEILARKIIEIARAGERDAVKLSAAVINSLDPLQINGRPLPQ
jgi:hypothetical protein